MLAVSLIASFWTGIASSLLTWWALTRLVRPRLKWDTTISKYRFSDDRPNSFRYQVALRNASRRTAVDVSIRIRLSIPGLVSDRVTEHITLRRETLPQIAGKKVVRWRVRIDKANYEAIHRYEKYLPDTLWQQGAKGPRVDLCELMAVFPTMWVEVSALGSDQYTWARTFALQNIYKEGVRVGRRRGKDHTGQLTISRDDEST